MNSASTPRNDITRAAGHALWASAAFSLTGICVKGAAPHAPTEMIVFFRNAGAAAVLLPWILRRGVVASLGTQRPWGHALRTVFGMCAMYCFFYAIGRLPLAPAMLMTYSTPLWVPFIAWIWLHE